MKAKISILCTIDVTSIFLYLVRLWHPSNTRNSFILSTPDNLFVANVSNRGDTRFNFFAQGFHQARANEWLLVNAKWTIFLLSYIMTRTDKFSIGWHLLCTRLTWLVRFLYMCVVLVYWTTDQGLTSCSTWDTLSWLQVNQPLHLLLNMQHA
jgi:hypothetical protein